MIRNRLNYKKPSHFKRKINSNLEEEEKSNIIR